MMLAAGLAAASLSVASPVEAAIAAAPRSELAPAPATQLAPAPGEELTATDAAAAASADADDFEYAVPVEGIGQPDGRMGIQDQVTEVGREAQWFHDWLLLPIITVITVMVLVLLLWIVVRYNRRSNPVPSKTTHNTTLEVIWTLVPVLILVAIAVPSISLLARQYDLPEGDVVTVKVTGNQWYWTYEYPDYGGLTIISNMLEEEGEQAEGARFRTDADGPRLLAADERMVIPAGTTVRFLVTASDVIHSFAVPAFWTKIDAVPGRLNEGWVNVDRPGVYYGQCSELCGARHAFMPIAVEVVPPAQFARWVRARGGSMPGDASSADAGSAPATALGESSAMPVNTNTVAATTEAVVVDQAAATN